MNPGAGGASPTGSGSRLRQGVVLAVLVVGAVVARAHGITDRTFTHPEMHVPRVEVPEWADNPPPKDSLESTLAITVARDVHPPGFYLLMWLWTGVFGTGLLALRLPLVLASAACVLLAYRLACRDDGRSVALLTAALVAFHGHLVFFSQLARPWGWVVFFGLLSVVLLRELEAGWSRWKAVAYVLSVAAGLWVEHTFWIFFAAQGIWIAFHGAHRREVPRTLRLQGVAAALGSPGLVFLWVQFGRGGYLEAGSLTYLGEIARLNRIVDADLLRAGLPPWGGYVAVLLTLTGGALLASGILLAPARDRAPARMGDGPAADRTAGQGTVEDRTDLRQRRPAAGWAVHPLAALAPLLLYVPYGHVFDIPAVAILGALMASAFLALGALSCATWRRWRGVVGWIARRQPLGRILSDLPSVQLVLPVAAVFALSQIRPLLASRTFLVYTPLILLLASRGLARWARGRGPRLVAAAVLVPLVALSVHQYETLPHDQHDYKALAERMAPFVLAGDLVVLRNSWWAQPMHYHLPAAARALPPARLDDILANARGSPATLPRRVWVVAFGDEPFLSRRLARLSEPLQEYRSRRRLTAFNCTAVLFELDYAELARGGG